jgi:hypothetical protein
MGSTQNVMGRYQLPPIPPAMRMEGITDADLELVHIKFPSFPRSPVDVPSSCVTCGGRKVFKWLTYSPEHEEGEVAEYLCPCPDQWFLHACFYHANIGARYQKLSWRDALHVENDARALVWDYLNDGEARVKAGAGFIFTSETGGNGKTLLSALLLKGLIGRGFDGYFCTFAEMIDTYAGGWYDRETKAIFHGRILNARVLVLDDVGKEWKGKNLGLTEATFDTVIRHRVNNGLPTFVTTNLSVEQLGQGYGGSVLSLLAETCVEVPMIGESFRTQAKDRLLYETRLGLTRPIVVG